MGWKHSVSARMVARAIRSMALSARLAAARAWRTAGRFAVMLASGVAGKMWATICAVMAGTVGGAIWRVLVMVGIWVYPPRGYIPKYSIERSLSLVYTKSVYQRCVVGLE